MLRWCAWIVTAVVWATSSTPARAEGLSLSRAIAMALSANPQVQAAGAAEAAARDRRAAAQAAWLPRVELQEGWQRGTQPVFVFSSLLAQRRFTEANFAIDSLNHPDAMDNHRAAVMVRQPLFDPGPTLAAGRSARTLESIATADRRQTSLDIAVAVAEAYTAALTAQAAARAAEGAIEAATEDRDRARARRDAGTATDADVLALEVHLAQMRARDIDLRNDTAIARTRLNHLLGQPLDADWELAEPPASSIEPGSDRAALERIAMRDRPDVAIGSLRVSLAEQARLAATSARLPRVAFDGGFEWNGASWDTRASAWVVGVQAGFSWSAGGAERAQARAASQELLRARALKADAESAARLDVQAARLRLDAARARAGVGDAAVSQARESERIIRDRFAAGLATVTDVLRAAQAALDADALATSARMDVALSFVRLERALGQVPGTTRGQGVSP